MLGTAFLVGLLLLTNAVGVLLVALQLPGTWLIVGATALAAWLLREQATLGWGTLGCLLVLAIAGEIVETAAGAIGSRRSGGSRRGALLSIPTAIVGGTLGASFAGSLSLALSWIVPVWLGIVVLGAAVGAAIGAVIGDRWAGRSWPEAGRAGYGAAVGRIWGTAGKLIVAGVMWAVVLAAILL